MAIPGNKDQRDGFLFSLPFIAVYLLFMVFPIGFGLFISFFKWDILSEKLFIGLGNYLNLFKDKGIGYPFFISKNILLNVQ